MNKIIALYGNGVTVKNIRLDLDYIAIDGGINTLNKLKIKPIAIIGDMDSSNYDNNNVEVVKANPKKDETDTRLAIEYAIKNGYETLVIYAVTGKRLDHFLSIIRTLFHYSKINIFIVDDYNLIYLLNSGKHQINKYNNITNIEYKYLSFFSLNDVILTIDKVLYPLNKRLIKSFDDYNVSNEIIDKYCNVAIDNTIIVIQSREIN